MNTQHFQRRDNNCLIKINSYFERWIFAIKNINLILPTIKIMNTDNYTN